jgi:hypothetical protein
LSSGSAAAAHGCVAYSPIHKGAVKRIELRQKRGDLGQEGVSKDAGYFLVSDAARVAHQLRDSDTESDSEALERPRVGMALPFSIFEM